MCPCFAKILHLKILTTNKGVQQNKCHRKQHNTICFTGTGEPVSKFKRKQKQPYPFFVSVLVSS